MGLTATATATAAVLMLVEEVGASALAAWSREPVRVTSKKCKCVSVELSMKWTCDVSVSMRLCVRVDVGTMHKDSFCSGSHLHLRSRQWCRWGLCH